MVPDSAGLVSRSAIPLPPPPPTNADTRAAIDRVAAYTARNGPDFESIIMKEHKYNPEFRFLFDRGSPEYQYYRWAIQQNLLGRSPGAVPGSSVSIAHSTGNIPPWQQPPQTQNVGRNPSSQNLGQNSRQKFVFSVEEWESIVSSVDVSKQSVKTASDWLFRCQLTKDVYHDSIIAIKSRMMSIGFEPQDFLSKLALLYLVNEILHRAKHEQGSSLTPHPFILECCGHLGAMLQHVYSMNSPSNQQQVEGVVDLWRKRSIIPPATCDVLRAQMIMELVTPKRNRDRIDPREFGPELPYLPPNAVLASTFIVLPSEVVEACKGAPPYTTLNQLAFSALARRVHLGTTRDYDRESKVLDDFYDSLEALGKSQEQCGARDKKRANYHDHGRRSMKDSRSPSRSRSRSRGRYRSRSSTHTGRYSRSPSVEKPYRRASRSRSWSRGRSPSPARY